MVGHQRVLFCANVMQIAGPREICRRGSQTTAYRILFNIMTAKQQIKLGGEHRSLVAPLPQSAAAAVLLIEIRHVVAPYQLHHSCQPFNIGRRCQQMEMVWHQYVGVNGNFEASGAFFEPVKEDVMISGIAENRLLVMATLNDVVRLQRNNETG